MSLQMSAASQPALLLAVLLLAFLCGVEKVVAVSVTDMLNSMSLEAKIGQMVQIDISVFMIPGTSQVNQTFLHEYILEYQIGSILNSPFSGGPIDGLTGWNATQWRELIQSIQSSANQTSTGIPIMYGIDSIHGATYIRGAALFPQSINLAATFNPDLAYQAGLITAKDTRAAAIPWIFAPVLGLGLQPLWARFPETFGEDPYLAGQMGAAIIRGMQEVVNDGGYPQQAAACMKHFIGYSLPTNGHDRAPVQLPDRILRELYIPSFKAAVDAGVLTAMESYNEVGGVPMVSNTDYLSTLIRKEFGWEGFMVTDYQEIENLHNFHMVSPTQLDAVELTMQSTTVDMSMVPLDTSFYTYLLELVQSGVVSEDRINESVRRILTVKQRLGLLERSGNDVPLDDPNIATVGQASDWEASLNTSRESIVLGKNTNNLLPLSSTAKVLLTGPTCNSSISQTGGWAIHWQGVYYDWEFTHQATVLSALTTLYPSLSVTYLPGPAINATSLQGVNMSDVFAAMDAVDVVLVCLGEESYAEKPGDIDDLHLPAGQVEYVESMSEYNPSMPLVTVMIQGRPRLMSTIASASQAVVLAMQGGPLGGQAIAEVVMGDVNPSGRLPFTYPYYSGDVVYQYHHKPSELCTERTGFHSAAYVPCTTQFDFGTGLSYTTWTYSSLTLSASRVSEQDILTVSVVVTNTGSRAGKHAVMLFLFDLYRRVSPEYKKLVKFTKVSLPEGESQVVSWNLTAVDWEYVGVESHYVLESGEMRLGVSPYVDCRSATDLSTTTVSTQDTTSGSEPMCAAFNFTTTVDYSPTCNQACAMWTNNNSYAWLDTSPTGYQTTFTATSASYVNVTGQGICSVVLTNASQCLSTCQAQVWTWDYVDCITTYYKTPTCVDFNTVQCYDAFGMQSMHSEVIVDDDDDDDKKKYGLPAMFVFLALGGVLGMAIGALLFYLLLPRLPFYKRMMAEHTISEPLLNPVV